MEFRFLHVLVPKVNVTEITEDLPISIGSKLGGNLTFFMNESLYSKVMPIMYLVVKNGTECIVYRNKKVDINGHSFAHNDILYYRKNQIENTKTWIDKSLISANRSSFPVKTNCHFCIA